MVLSYCEKYLKKNSPKQPIIIVTSNWLMLPTIASEIALMRLPFSIYKIRPPYSPILLGVSMVILQPDKTDLKALKKENAWICFTSNLHFMASILQLVNIKKTTSHNFQLAQLFFILFHCIPRLGLSITWWYKLHDKIRNSSGPKKKLINILIFLFKKGFFIFFSTT